ncbi:unnamed protein product [Adineta steineri]|uniref:Uncharacterized protein n=1 Tax=Adineta steineri TaxID=433720 RepID=A0A819ILG5_9BILA|nr:unnamed protein product [Adineta steineri]
MPVTDIDIVRQQFLLDVLFDGVDFILYSYNEYSFDEKYFQSVTELLNVYKTDIEANKNKKDKYYWIEVINYSCITLPHKIKILCEYFHIHPLTIEDITTLVSSMKLDLFNNNGSLYLLMKILTWNGKRIEQQQISFYLNCSQNLLITFQRRHIDQPFFQTIRNRLRRNQHKNNDDDIQYCQNTRLRQLNVDYLFYCLLDDIIDRYMCIMEEIANRIGQYDEMLMLDTKSRTLNTLYSIYYLKHDLLHLRILFNPLKEIITRLQRTTFDEPYISYPRTDPLLRLGLKHHIVRRQAKTARSRVNSTDKKPQLTSNYFNEYIYVYLNDLNNHIDQLIDSLETQRECVSNLISFWIALNSNDIQEILEFLMLITVLFMPCTLLTGSNSTNFYKQAQLEYHYGYYIILAVLALIASGMVLWYKVKKWI